MKKTQISIFQTVVNVMPSIGRLKVMHMNYESTTGDDGFHLLINLGTGIYICLGDNFGTGRKVFVSQ